MEDGLGLWGGDTKKVSMTISSSSIQMQYTEPELFLIWRQRPLLKRVMIKASVICHHTERSLTCYYGVV